MKNDHLIEHDGFDYLIRVGKNAQHNWNLISEADQNDIWLHLESFPSPHITISRVDHDEPIPKYIIREGAQLCKSNSKMKNMKNLTVMYTLIKNVKKTKTVGEVDVKGKYQTVKV